MSKQFVSDLKEKDAIQSVFLVGDKFSLKDKNGKPYLSLNLSDVSGTINARLWDRVDELQKQFEAGDFVMVKGHVQVFQSKRQVVVHDIKPAQSEQFEMSDFLKTTTQSVDVLFAQLQEIVAQIKNPHLKRLLEDVISDEEIKPLLLKGPAAKTIHHAYIGGLLEHIVSICGLMKGIAAHYSFLDLDLLYFGAIFHDIGKVWELEVADGFSYTDRGRLIGHITIACEIIDDKARAITGFPQELKDICKHIVLSHHGRLEYGSPKRPKVLEAVVVAMVDDMDSQLNTLLGFMQGELEEGSSWTRYHQNYDRYFFLDVLREQLKAPK